LSSPPLSTTSYAILGVLAMRPWAAYELTGYMRTSAVRHLWPRTESRLYAEPKNLVAHGLARAEKEYTGKRRRTIYRITDEGRSRLARWLGERAAAPQTEDEAMLKIFFADYGSKDDLLSTIRWAIRDLQAQIAAIRKISDRLERGEPAFPGRVHVTSLAASYTVARMRQRFEYLRWAAEWVRGWNDTALDDEKRSAAVELHRTKRAELDTLDRELEELLGGEGGTPSPGSASR
jgi:DNA-binding PadR family transcriptional regulator